MQLKEALTTAMAEQEKANAPKTVIAGVNVVGYNLVSPTYLLVLECILGLDEFKNAVDAITLSEDQPVIDGNSIFAGFDPETRTMILNLGHHWKASVKLAEEDKTMISMRAHIWYNLLTSTFHELYHGAMGDVSDQPIEEIEKMCGEMADEAVANFVREYECEPGPMAEEPFFGPRFMELFIKRIKDGTSKWQIRQNNMYDEVHVFMDGDEQIRTFREWLRVTTQGDPEFKDKRWDEPALTIEPIVKTEAEEELPFEPDTVAEHVVNADGVIDIKPIATALEGGHGINESTIKMMDMEDTDEAENLDVMPDTETLPPTAAQPAPKHARPLGVPGAAPVTSIGAHEPVVLDPTVGVCHNCQQRLNAEFAFCGHCGVPKAAPVGVAPAVAAGPAIVPQNVRPMVVAPPRTELSAVALTPPGMGTQRLVKPLRSNLANINYTTEQARFVMEQVFHYLLYEQIFNKCGYQIAQPQYAPERVGAILQPVSLAHIPGVEGFLIGYDKMENNIFRKNQPVLNGVVSGLYNEKKGLPFYSLYFNCNGIEVSRKLWPQNLWKQKGDNPTAPYSATATQAQQGHLIGWVMDGQVSGQFSGKIKFVNGVAEWLV